MSANFENKKVVNLMDRLINKTFIDSKTVSNKVYMFIDCINSANITAIHK